MPLYVPEVCADKVTLALFGIFMHPAVDVAVQSAAAAVPDRKIMTPVPLSCAELPKRIGPVTKYRPPGVRLTLSLFPISILLYQPGGNVVAGLLLPSTNAVGDA